MTTISKTLNGIRIVYDGVSLNFYVPEKFTTEQRQEWEHENKTELNELRKTMKAEWNAISEKNVSDYEKTDSESTDNLHEQIHEYFKNFNGEPYVSPIKPSTYIR